MSCRKILPALLLSISSLFLFSFSGFAQADGEALFKQNCAACHSVGKGIVIGPDLKDVAQRRPADWLRKWIKSSATVIKSGDAYGAELLKKFNNVGMPDQNLSDVDIDAVLAFIDNKGKEAPAPVAAAPVGGTEGSAGNADNTGTWVIVAIVLVALMYILSTVKNRLEKVVRAKKGLPEPAKLPWREWARGNKKLIAVCLILMTVFGSVKGWYVLAGIGISQNYQPDQPINFSHKIHAGNMNIACIYCHSGAEKSKTAGVPSANVCMNCHKFIKEGKTTGKTEIAKIYAALDYNPETQKYGDNPKPIQWVRVHNLPDLAYFNHSQHVKVGGIQCEKCHGDVKEMGVAKQFAPLTMGWCIECHQQTPVNTAGNKYYDNFHSLHFNKHDKKDTIMTVEKMGGTECAKCHY